MSRAISTATTAVGLLAVAACSAAPPPHRFATATELPDEPRRAPGVAVDPASRLPRTKTEGDSHQSVVVLRTPHDVELAREVVRRFFRAVLRESPEELNGLLAESAWSRSPGGGATNRARALWHVRLARLDYGALRGRMVYRETEMETYRREDLQRLRATRPPPLSAGEQEVVVRVPISIARAGRVRLFGDEIWFRLGPEGDGYRIIELVEDFRLQ